MIPSNLDYHAMLRDLNEMGLSDFRIDTILGFGAGYCAQVRRGAIHDMSYPKAARLYNFWFDERRLRARENPNSPVHTTT